ncbi:MAG: hypothetical protein JO199_09130 [Candidatus Eremiobacteraeota bacterium]|nr:hypothetical protein [Candidatus Eremiobacteraeota bacterium]
MAATAACGPKAAASASPSALTGDPTTYDGQSVSVSGTVKNPHTRQGRRGTIDLYQLCDTACINVVQFGNAALPSEGSTVSETGTFRATFGRVKQISNVLMVGGRPGGGHWNGGASPGAASSPG